MCISYKYKSTLYVLVYNLSGGDRAKLIYIYLHIEFLKIKLHIVTDFFELYSILLWTTKHAFGNDKKVIFARYCSRNEVQPSMSQAGSSSIICLLGTCQQVFVA